MSRLQQLLEETKAAKAKESYGEEYGNAVKALRRYIAGMRHRGPDAEADQLEAMLDQWIKEEDERAEVAWQAFLASVRPRV